VAKERSLELKGPLQLEVMQALWRLDRGSVDEVRRALPSRRRGAYTTIQTVLNRLAERGLLRRQREGNMIFYAATVSEADYYSRSLRQTLSQASADARRMALAHVVGELEPGELDEIEALAERVAQQRNRRGS
jgi:predicted transcriptional regulator